MEILMRWLTGSDCWLPIAGYVRDSAAPSSNSCLRILVHRDGPRAAHTSDRSSAHDRHRQMAPVSRSAVEVIDTRDERSLAVDDLLFQRIPCQHLLDSAPGGRWPWLRFTNRPK